MTRLKPCNPRNTTHGAYARDERLYTVWSTMMHRCEDPKREKYQAYGGRGIKICSSWHDPNIFIDWAHKNGYRQGLQIDRINNDGNYEPNNCRWVTPKINSRNRRNTKYLTIGNDTKCVSEWCETLPISEYTIYWWIRKFGKEYAEKRLTDMAIKAWDTRAGDKDGTQHQD